MTNPPSEAEESREHIAELDRATRELLTLAKDDSLGALTRIRLLDLVRELAAERSAEQVRMAECDPRR